MILYAATSNQGKLAEFATSASGAGVEVLALPGLRDMPEPLEDATTFMGNAEKKAIAYSLHAPGLLVFADDSGIEADALGGDPGVRSARFAADLNFEPGIGTKDERNNRCLLKLLAAVPNATRAGRFVCALAVARDAEHRPGPCQRQTHGEEHPHGNAVARPRRQQRAGDLEHGHDSGHEHQQEHRRGQLRRCPTPERDVPECFCESQHRSIRS